MLWLLCACYCPPRDVPGRVRGQRRRDPAAAGVWRLPRGAWHVVPCGADCNRNGQVTVEELVRTVGVLVGTERYEGCAAADGNEDGAVTVDEVVRGVRNVLTSCV